MSGIGPLTIGNPKLAEASWNTNRIITAWQSKENKQDVYMYGWSKKLEELQRSFTLRTR